MNAVEIWDATHKINKIAVVLDFDGVLFDNDALQRALAFSAPREINISSETMERACRMASDFGCHLPRIERIYKAIRAYDSVTNLSFEMFRDFVFRTTKKTAFQLQYRDASYFLRIKNQLEDRVDFFILTRGDREFQMLKIKESGVLKYFEPSRIFVAATGRGALQFLDNSDKGPYIYELSKTYRAILFADDKLRQLREVHDFMEKQGVGDYPAFYLWVNRHLTFVPSNTNLFSLYVVPDIYKAIELAEDIVVQCEPKDQTCLK